MHRGVDSAASQAPRSFPTYEERQLSRVASTCEFFSLLTYITLVTTAVFVKPMDILVRIQEKSQVGTGLGVYHHCLK